MSWLHVSRPDAVERRRLEEELKLPPALLAHALDLDEMARIDRAGDVTLVVLRVPSVEDQAAPLPFRSLALGVFFHNGEVVTVTAGETDVMERFAPPQGSPIAFVLRLMLATAERFLEHLRKIERTVDEVESQLKQSLSNREVLTLLRYQKSLVHFTTALRANEVMLDRLLADPHLKLSEAEEELHEDILVELRQAIQMTSVAEEILSQMMDAFASIISNNLNVVMKALTSLTIILGLPTMVASFYGMNVALPLAQHPYAFLMTILVALVISGATAWLFWRRRWL